MKYMNHGLAAAVFAAMFLAPVVSTHGAVVGQAYDLAVSALNPVVRYQFEESSGPTAVNTGSAGAPNNGTYTGAGVTLGAGGAFPQLGNAGAFSGTSGYVSIPDANTTFEQPNKSIQFWFYRDSTSITGRRDMWTDKVTSGRDFGIFSDSSGANSVQVFKEYPSEGGGGVTVTSIADNTWHDLVLTMSGTGASTTWKLYIDGAQVGATMTGAVFQWDSNWNGNTKRLGTSGDSTTTTFPGFMDEFALYPTELTAQQVADLHAAAQLPLSVVPEPQSILLAACGLLGLVGLTAVRRRRK